MRVIPSGRGVWPVVVPLDFGGKMGRHRFQVPDGAILANTLSGGQNTVSQAASPALRLEHRKGPFSVGGAITFGIVV